MRDTVPEEDLLLLLRPDAAVSEEELQKVRLGLLEDGISPRLQVTQIRKDSFLKLFGIENGAAGLRETEDENLDNVRAGDKELSAPEDAGNVFAVGELVGADGGIFGFGPELWGRGEESL